MCFCDYDQPEFCNEIERRARKTYKCEECHCEIAPGQRYLYISGKWGDGVDTFRWCLNCKRARDTFVAKSECGCWAYGNLLEDIRDEWQHSNGPLWLGRLVVGMENRWGGAIPRHAFPMPAQVGV